MDFGWFQSIVFETKVSQNVKISLFPKFQPYNPSGLAIGIDGLKQKNHICVSDPQGNKAATPPKHLYYDELKIFSCKNIFFGENPQIAFKKNPRKRIQIQLGMGCNIAESELTSLHRPNTSFSGRIRNINMLLCVQDVVTHFMQ